MAFAPSADQLQTIFVISAAFCSNFFAALLLSIPLMLRDAPSEASLQASISGLS
jgi:hypothetical protein